MSERYADNAALSQREAPDEERVGNPSDYFVRQRAYVRALCRHSSTLSSLQPKDDAWNSFYFHFPI